MNCPAGLYERQGDLVIRPVPEWDACMVYQRSRRRVVHLNLSAWLMLELAEPAQSFGALMDSYTRHLGDLPTGRSPATYAHSALGQLMAQGLIRLRAEAQSGCETTGGPT